MCNPYALANQAVKPVCSAGPDVYNDRNALLVSRLLLRQLAEAAVACGVPADSDGGGATACWSGVQQQLREAQAAAAAAYPPSRYLNAYRLAIGLHYYHPTGDADDDQVPAAHRGTGPSSTLLLPPRAHRKPSPISQSP